MVGNFDLKNQLAMKFHSTLWLSVILTAVIQCLQHVSAQPGFLSLDCGALAPYVDNSGISWVPDDKYIVGGAKAVTKEVVEGVLGTLRYFPDTTRTRYCYNLPTDNGQTYFLRTKFYHGSYDSSPNISFDVTLDIFQVKVTWTFPADKGFYIGESYFQAFKDNIQFCLYRLRPADNPFISAIELRPLDSTMYATVLTGSSLQLHHRYDMGNDVRIRYPMDKYDRYWFPDMGSSKLLNISADLEAVMDSNSTPDKAPAAVMRTALITNIPNATLPSIYVTYRPPTSFSNNSYLINIYLAELEKLNTSRVLDILVNGKVVEADVNVSYRALNTLYKPVEISTMSTVDATGSLNITVARSALSVAPPIWNALEVFSVHPKQAGTLASDVKAIEGIKKAFGLASAWTGDPCLYLPYDWLTCSDSPPRVTEIKLSSANLSGPFPDLQALTSLTTLHLENNSLTGAIPEWLAILPNLQELYLQNNNFSGNVPKGLLNLKSLRLEGNPRLCLNTTCASDDVKKKSSLGLPVGVVGGVLLAVVTVLGIVLCICRRRRAKANTTNPSLLSQSATEEGATSRGSRYTLAQVRAATGNYAKVLGKGGFGPVYYGKLGSGQEVAVKVAAKGSGQGSKEFINEVELLTRVHHKNLVSLVGYCDEGDNLILLYEYMPQGTVQAHLYGVGEQKREFSLDWETRLQIALNSAQGLEYLHMGCQPVIYHRDVKSNNILLSNKLVAKVADFGLSKSTNSEENVTHMSTMVKGTIGYLDPEYFISNQLTDKSDVYGFGIVLLELICGRPPIQHQLPEDQRRIDQWVRPLLQAGRVEEIVDPALAGQYNVEAMWKVAELAMESVEPKGKDRPDMSTVVQELRAAIAMQHQYSSFNSNASNPDPNFMADTPVR